MNPDRELTTRMRAQLPAKIFSRRPARALLMLPLLAIPIISGMAIVVWNLSFLVAIPLALLSGNAYAGLMLLGHEIGHNATVQHRGLQTFLLIFCLGIFCISPHIWRYWHNQAHHGHTNSQPLDPDNFGDLSGFRSNRLFVKWLARLGPGSGHWLSVFYLFFGLTVHSANVLLRKSRHSPIFARVNRRRAIAESVAIATFWLLLAVAVGPFAAMFIVVIPMLVANFIVTSYFITNHSLRPLTAQRDTLGTTVDVATWKLLDHLHFHTSHHAEHHLFPSMCTSQLPAVRAWLDRNAADRFVVIPHWRALQHAYGSPKVYDGPTTLVEPFSGRRVDIHMIETQLYLDKLRYKPRLPT